MKQLSLFYIEEQCPTTFTYNNIIVHGCIKRFEHKPDECYCSCGLKYYRATGAVTHVRKSTPTFLPINDTKKLARQLAGMLAGARARLGVVVGGTQSNPYIRKHYTKPLSDAYDAIRRVERDLAKLGDETLTQREAKR